MTNVRNRLPVLVAAGLVVAALLLSVFGEVGIISTWRMDSTRQQLAAGNEGLREEIGRLRAEVDRLRTDAAHIEEIARTELGLIGEQENVIVLDRNRDVPPRDPPPGGTKRR